MRSSKAKFIAFAEREKKIRKGSDLLAGFKMNMNRFIFQFRPRRLSPSDPLNLTKKTKMHFPGSTNSVFL